ncbi:MAG: hypothetical protein GY861_21380 [bacterium]|nr:hypothetical protein [bacterium]
MSNIDRKEIDFRIKLFRSLTSIPHGDLDSIYPIHLEAIQADPDFYPHIACMYFDTGEVRDNKVAFAACLISAFSNDSTANRDLVRELRDVGCALAREMNPKSLCRVRRYLKKSTPVKGEKSRRTGIGLSNVPSCFDTEVKRYMKEREANSHWFDTCVLTFGKYMRELYCSHQICPSSRAQEVLFDRKYPEGCLVPYLQEIRDADPGKKAELLDRYKFIPYMPAISVVKRPTPDILSVLVERMSDQQLVNNLDSLKKRGALKNEVLRKYILGRIRSLKGSSTAKPMVAAKSGFYDSEVTEALLGATEKAVKRRFRISANWALAADKSDSMAGALSKSMEIAAMAASSSIDGTEFHLYKFDSIATEISVPSYDLPTLSNMLSRIPARGTTSVGSVFKYAVEKGHRNEVFVFVSDFRENEPPVFLDGLGRYIAHTGSTPSIVLVAVGNYQVSENAIREAQKHNPKYSCLSVIERGLKSRGIDVNVVYADGDHYSYGDVLTFMAKKSLFDIVMEVMDYPLKRRRP